MKGKGEVKWPSILGGRMLIRDMGWNRWGDAPVHSIFASLYLRKDEVHYFHDIGYQHSTYQHCPESEELQSRCYCDPVNTLDYTDPMSCLNQYMYALDEDSPGTDETVGDLLVAA